MRYKTQGLLVRECDIRIARFWPFFVRVRTKCEDMKCEDPISQETWAFFVTRPSINSLIFRLFFDPIGTSWEGLEGISHFNV